MLAPELDALGRVIDFGEVKSLLGDWIAERWDHNLLLHQNDPLAIMWREGNREVFGGREPFIMRTGYDNPTAENIACVFGRVASHILPAAISVAHVRFYETPNSWADYKL